MFPEPVATDNSTRPLTVRVRSKLASEAIAGSANANAAIATRIFIPHLEYSDQLSVFSEFDDGFCCFATTALQINV
jgi:hypothetical protein